MATNGALQVEGTFSFHVDRCPREEIECVAIRRSFGVIGPEKEVYKFRVEVVAKRFGKVSKNDNPHFNRILAPREDGTDGFDKLIVCASRSVRNYEMPENPEEREEWAVDQQLLVQDTSCQVKICNLNSFGVHISAVVALKYAIEPYVFNYEQNNTALASNGESDEEIGASPNPDNGSHQLWEVGDGKTFQFMVKIKVHDVVQQIPDESLERKIALMYDDKSTSDYNIVCEGRIFYVHKFVLNLRSDSLKSMLETEGIQEVTNNEMVIPDFSSDTVLAFIKYLYTGLVEPKDINCELLLLADKYLVKGLSKVCENFLAQFGRATPQDVVDIAINGCKVNSETLTQAAWDDIKTSKKEAPELAAAWAEACEKTPTLKNLSKSIGSPSGHSILKCFLEPTTSNITLLS